MLQLWNTTETCEMAQDQNDLQFCETYLQRKNGHIKLTFKLCDTFLAVPMPLELCTIENKNNKARGYRTAVQFIVSKKAFPD